MGLHLFLVSRCTDGLSTSSHPRPHRPFPGRGKQPRRCERQRNDPAEGKIFRYYYYSLIFVNQK
ncbi:MAG: hypothetical protein CW342_10195 [Thermoactinomycetaceae bacterium]|nr:hypothetical protein [Bacillota bacterium]MBO2533238.1 hypothetical protein [Thermoactinomycetaceae bacterium]